MIPPPPPQHGSNTSHIGIASRCVKALLLFSDDGAGSDDIIAAACRDLLEPSTPPPPPRPKPPEPYHMSFFWSPPDVEDLALLNIPTDATLHECRVVAQVTSISPIVRIEGAVLIQPRTAVVALSTRRSRVPRTLGGIWGRGAPPGTGAAWPRGRSRR
jgi:hypothetical protein